MTSPVNVDVKLGVNKFNVDEEHPHIVVKSDADKQALELLVKACPAGLYKNRMTAAYASITPDVWSVEPAAFLGWGRRWSSGNTRAAPLAWSFVTADVGLIRNAVLTPIAKKQDQPMQPSRNFDDLKFSSIHRRILLWGSGGPFLDGYVLVMIGVALEQLTPALKLDADWIGLLGAGTLAGLFVGTSLFGYISDKVGRRKMFLIDIIAIGGFLLRRCLSHHLSNCW